MNVREPPPIGDEKVASLSDARPPSRGFFLIITAMAVGALAWGAYGRWQQYAAAVETQQRIVNFLPEVRVTLTKRLDGPVLLTLPGTVLPFDQARIFTRATGYVAERHVDIGSRVHKGDLLLRIAAPDLDHQLSEAEARLVQMESALVQARAAAEQAHSDAMLADVTNTRTSRLATQGWESKQTADTTRLGLASKLAAVDNAEAGVKVAEASIRAQQATVQRLRQLTQFEQVEAPFDGVITARNVDKGDLVKADDSSGGAPLLVVQRDDIVRVQANVPQSGAVGIQDGLPARVRVPELPGRTFGGNVSRNAAALDAASRTMLVEVDVPNPEGKLRPGLYVEVEFGIPRTVPTVLIPADALLFNEDGLRVATVDDAGRVHLRSVIVYRDYGMTLELRHGLEGGERIVVSPPADIAEGQQVKVAAQAVEPKTGAKK
jgi:HlyD family secretion protein